MHPDEINELRRLYQAGQISSMELEAAESKNALRDVMMPQPRYDVAPMLQNSMRTESGPMAGNVISMDFAQNAGPPAPKLGEAIEYMGRKGRYSADGRKIVFADGSTEDMHPERTKRLEEEDYVRKERANKLSMAEILKRKGEAELAQTTAQTAALTAKPAIDPNSQPELEKRYGKAEKGKRWSRDGRLEPIPGGDVEQGAAQELAAGADVLTKIDGMIGKRDANGQLVEGSAPHKGFRGAVGTAIPGIDGATVPFASYIPGTDAADFKARLDEIKGGAFLKAFESLKGGGAISEVEGRKATDAITRMSMSQSENEFVQAALEFRGVVERGMQKAAAMRGQPQGQPQAQPQGQPQSKIPAGMTREQVIAEAQKAIAQGKDPNAVKQRLAAMGISL